MHSESSTDTEDHDEQDEGDKAGRRGAVPRVGNSTHNDEKNRSAEELITTLEHENVKRR